MDPAVQLDADTQRRAIVLGLEHGKRCAAVTFSCCAACSFWDAQRLVSTSTHSLTRLELALDAPSDGAYSENARVQCSDAKGDLVTLPYADSGPPTSIESWQPSRKSLESGGQRQVRDSLVSA